MSFEGATLNFGSKSTPPQNEITQWVLVSSVRGLFQSGGDDTSANHPRRNDDHPAPPAKTTGGGGAALMYVCCRICCSTSSRLMLNMAARTLTTKKTTRSVRRARALGVEKKGRSVSGRNIYFHSIAGGRKSCGFVPCYSSRVTSRERFQDEDAEEAPPKNTTKCIIAPS